MMRILTQILSAFALCCWGLSGQTPAKPEFEVASIKPSPEPTGGTHDSRGRARRARKQGPDPLYSAAHDVDGSADHGLSRKALSDFRAGVAHQRAIRIMPRSPKGDAKEDFGPMLQNLLAERFGLVVHHETKQMPVYDLVVFAKTVQAEGACGRTPASAERWGEAACADGDAETGTGQRRIPCPSGEFRRRPGEFDDYDAGPGTSLGSRRDNASVCGMGVGSIIETGDGFHRINRKIRFYSVVAE